MKSPRNRMARILFAIGAIALLSWSAPLHATITTTNPYEGITLITDTDPSSVPQPVSIHVAEINLTAPGISFELSPPTTPPSPYNQQYVTTQQPTLAYMQKVGAQMAVNASFFYPYPGANNMYTNIVGFAASDGNIYSPFQTPVQSYAIVTDAPAINITQNNQAQIVNDNTANSSGTHVLQNVSIYNAFSGSGQIITNGAVTIPVYKDATHPNGLLTPNGTYSNSYSWYNLTNARTVIGLTQNDQTLVIFTVDNAGGSHGMSLGEVANYLLTNYGVYNALNCDGGGSTTLAMENPTNGQDSLLNVSSNGSSPRAVAASLAIFAEPVPIPPAFLLMGSGFASLIFVRRRVFGA